MSSTSGIQETPHFEEPLEATSNGLAVVSQELLETIHEAQLALEDCIDGLDNNCDGMTDLADVEACPYISVFTYWPVQPMPISHGHRARITVELIPPDPSEEAPWTWSREWAVVDARPQERCQPEDIVLGDQEDFRSLSRRYFWMPDSATKTDCLYTVEARINGYATANMRVQMVNHLPEIQLDENAVYDGGTWHLSASTATPLSISVSASAST